MEFENRKRQKKFKELINHLNSVIESEENKIIEGLRFNFGPLGSINVPDIPSPGQIFDSIKGSIKSGLVDPVERGFNDTMNTIKTSLTTLINKARTVLEGMIEELKSFFENAMKTVKGWFDIMVEQMTSGFKVIGDFFAKAFDRLKRMGLGIERIFKGIGQEFTGLGEGLRLGFTNIGVLFKWVGDFVFSYITCGVSYIQNLHRCIFYYCLDAVLHLTYLPVRILLWLVSGFNKNIYEIESLIWDKIYYADSIVYKYAGFHFAHYPKSVRDLCYNCRRMKIDALKNKVNQINYTFNTKMPELLQSGITMMQEGSTDFRYAFIP